eukprot:7381921-Prymnesium_polylepis.1
MWKLAFFFEPPPLSDAASNSESAGVGDSSGDSAQGQGTSDGGGGTRSQTRGSPGGSSGGGGGSQGGGGSISNTAVVGLAALENVENVGRESVYAQDYLAGQAEKYLAWCHKLANDGEFQRYEQVMPGYPFMKAGPKLEWYLCECGWRAKYSRALQGL